MAILGWKNWSPLDSIKFMLVAMASVVGGASGVACGPKKETTPTPAEPEDQLCNKDTTRYTLSEAAKSCVFTGADAGDMAVSLFRPQNPYEPKEGETPILVPVTIKERAENCSISRQALISRISDISPALKKIVEDDKERTDEIVNLAVCMAMDRLGHKVGNNQVAQVFPQEILAAMNANQGDKIVRNKLPKIREAETRAEKQAEAGRRKAEAADALSKLGEYLNPDGGMPTEQPRQPSRQGAGPGAAAHTGKQLKGGDFLNSNND